MSPGKEHLRTLIRIIGCLVVREQRGGMRESLLHRRMLARAATPKNT
jgi:hypothetical protein